MEQRYQCRCCGYFTLVGETNEDILWDICPVCFWENDIFEDVSDRYSGANHMTLAQGRENYKIYSVCDPKHSSYVRMPQKEELPENNK